jgi:AcrR family transcriptional regulator
MSTKDTASRIIDAARACLLADGYAAMSTRKVADQAGVPLSQIHYHFGSKDDLIVGLLRAENEGRLERQAEMYGPDLPLSEQWEIACGFFDEDLASGYVRILQEMTAAGWSSRALADELKEVYGAWVALLARVAQGAGKQGLSLGGFAAEEIAALVSALFVGAESLILVGLESEKVPLRAALRKVGDLITLAEEQSRCGRDTRIETDT